MQTTTMHEVFGKLGSLTLPGAERYVILNGRQDVWYVQKGSVDVFSVHVTDGRAEGARSFFFDASEGELIFGISDSVPGFGRGLIMVPASGAELVCIPGEIFLNLLNQQTYTGLIAPLLDQWISHFSHGVSRDINPRTDQLLEPGTVTTLGSNLKIRAKKGVVWVEFLEGNALFLDLKEATELGRCTFFPVSRDSWLMTVGECRIRTLDTTEVCREGHHLEYLNYFYETVFYCDLFNSRLLSVDDLNQLHDREQRKKAVLGAAFTRIVSVIEERFSGSAMGEGHDPMLEACRLVAKSSDIRVSAPRRSKNDEGAPFTLNDILRASRFRARKVRCSGKWWDHDHGPLLGFLKENNAPVALIREGKGKYVFVNPAANTRIHLDEQSAGLLATEAWQFYRPFPEKPVTGAELVRFGFKSCGRDLFFILLAGLTGGLISLLVPVLSGVVFDEIIPRSDHHQLTVLMIVLLAGSLALTSFHLIKSLLMVRIENRLDFSLQSAIWDRLLNLPIPFFKHYQAGELASKANSIRMLRRILSDTVIYTVLGAIFLLMNFVIMFWYDARLTLFILFILMIAVALIFIAGTKIRKEQTKIIMLQNRIYGRLIQFLSNISKIRIAGTQVHAFGLWSQEFSENKRADIRVRNLALNITLLTQGLPMLIILIVFFVIAHRIPGTLSTGDFIAFFSALTVGIAAFLQIGQAVVSFFMALPYLENLKPILENVPENIALKPEIQHLSGEIEISNVSFRYDENTPLVLHNVSMHIHPGEFVAVVGASGSGKSTLLRLLLGFETPTNGAVYYDRQDIASIDPASVRRQAGTVLQQSRLSAGTILTNITGMTSATFEDAWEAARNVGLDEDIREMPMGMYTVVTEGLSTLSGGQRQRIMIARAIVSKPRILFFDEATSALDNKTQEIVNQSLERLQSTRVVIAHRLTTVMNADKIYLLENGRIAESGTYAELMALGGRFAGLVERQRLERG